MRSVIKGLLLLLVTIALLVGCSTSEEKSDDALTTEDIKALVHKYSTENIDDETASITSEELIITNNNDDETRITLPEDEFFVSIAPFETYTHECAIHSLTGCQGELENETFDVLIKDEEDNIVVDEQMETLANGFIDLWLDKNEVYTVTISQHDKEVTSELSTFEGDDTCITTMELS
ncbi:MAG TPA: CueP family metal-binding protein [Bacillota bacterium]|nr:CueP family metal-binding protein [Bacillota bacterium]